VTTGTEKSHSGTAIAIVLLALIVAGVVYRYWPSDEREIRRHLSNLAEGLSSPTTDSEVASITRLAALREYFAPEVRVRAGAAEIRSRETLVGLISQSRPSGLVVEFVDVKVAVSENHSAARIELTAKVSRTDPTSGESSLDARPATGTVEKRDGDWVITEVEFPDPPARP
jgi:hypothetical protein